MREDKGLEKIGQVLKNKRTIKKPPAYEWQDLALRIINELGVPNFKRSAVFKVCKNNAKLKVIKSLDDTKELCKTGESWKYFFKIIGIK